MPESASEDWNHLAGSTVELRRDGLHLRYGEVEVVSEDASIMWLRFDGIDGRQLIMKEDGYEVLRID